MTNSTPTTVLQTDLIECDESLFEDCPLDSEELQIMPPLPREQLLKQKKGALCKDLSQIVSFLLHWSDHLQNVRLNRQRLSPKLHSGASHNKQWRVVQDTGANLVQLVLQSIHKSPNLTLSQQEAGVSPLAFFPFSETRTVHDLRSEDDDSSLINGSLVLKSSSSDQNSISFVSTSDYCRTTTDTAIDTSPSSGHSSDNQSSTVASPQVEKSKPTTEFNVDSSTILNFAQEPSLLLDDHSRAMGELFVQRLVDDASAADGASHSRPYDHFEKKSQLTNQSNSVEKTQSTSRQDDEDDTILYCSCRKPASAGWMIACDLCDEWWHGRCVSITRVQSKKIDKFVCPSCELKTGCATTFKEKTNRSSSSSRKSSSVAVPHITNVPSAVVTSQSTAISEEIAPVQSVDILGININEIPKSLSEIYKDTDCGICLLDLYDGSSIHELEVCQHVFHLSCLHRCVGSRNCRKQCPKCFMTIGSFELGTINQFVLAEKRRNRAIRRYTSCEERGELELPVTPKHFVVGSRQNLPFEKSSTNDGSPICTGREASGSAHQEVIDHPNKSDLKDESREDHLSKKSKKRQRDENQGEDNELKKIQRIDDSIAPEEPIMSHEEHFDKSESDQPMSEVIHQEETSSRHVERFSFSEPGHTIESITHLKFTADDPTSNFNFVTDLQSSDALEVNAEYTFEESSKQTKRPEPAQNMEIEFNHEDMDKTSDAGDELLSPAQNDMIDQFDDPLDLELENHNEGSQSIEGSDTKRNSSTQSSQESNWSMKADQIPKRHRLRQFQYNSEDDEDMAVFNFTNKPMPKHQSQGSDHILSQDDFQFMTQKSTTRIQHFSQSEEYPKDDNFNEETSTPSTNTNYHSIRENAEEASDEDDNMFDYPPSNLNPSQPFLVPIFPQFYSNQLE